MDIIKIIVRTRYELNHEGHVTTFCVIKCHLCARLFISNWSLPAQDSSWLPITLVQVRIFSLKANMVTYIQLFVLLNAGEKAGYGACCSCV